MATVRCEFLCWFGLSFCFVATVRCKFLCWFDPSLCFVATVGCLFCEYLCWIDLELIGKCCLCLCSNNVKENEWKEEFLWGNQCHELCISPPIWLQYVPKVWPTQRRVLSLFYECHCSMIKITEIWETKRASVVTNPIEENRIYTNVVNTTMYYYICSGIGAVGPCRSKSELSREARVSLRQAELPGARSAPDEARTINLGMSRWFRSLGG